MNRFLLCSALLLLVSAPHVVGYAFAPWEQHTEGTSLTLTLGKQMIDGVSKTTIQVNVTNTSKVTEYYKGPDGFNLDIEIIIQKQDKDVPLRDYNWQGGSATRPPEIKPGDTLSRTVILSSDELTRITGNPVKCSIGIFVITDSGLVKRYIIDSSPKVLVEDPR